MSNLLRNRIPAMREHRLLLSVAVAAFFSIGVAASALALAGHKANPKVQFSILDRHSHKARTATAEPGIPAGAILAGVTNTDGTPTEIYVTRLSNGETCLTDLQIGKADAMACGRPFEVEANGVQVGLDGPNAPQSMAVLVPDGIPSATVTDMNGATKVQKVANNIIAVTDPDLASVAYTTPSGASKVFRVPHHTSSTSVPSTIVP